MGVSDEKKPVIPWFDGQTQAIPSPAYPPAPSPALLQYWVESPWRPMRTPKIPWFHIMFKPYMPSKCAGFGDGFAIGVWCCQSEQSIWDFKRFNQSLGSVSHVLSLVFWPREKWEPYFLDFFSGVSVSICSRWFLGLQDDIHSLCWISGSCKEGTTFGLNIRTGQSMGNVWIRYSLSQSKELSSRCCKRLHGFITNTREGRAVTSPKGRWMCRDTQ